MEIACSIHRCAVRGKAHELPQGHESAAVWCNPRNTPHHSGIYEDVPCAHHTALTICLDRNQLADSELPRSSGFAIDADWRASVIIDFDAIHTNTGKSGNQTDHASAADAASSRLRLLTCTPHSGLCLLACATDA
jgi:hypothetical protein